MTIHKLFALICISVLTVATVPTFAIRYDPVTNSYITDDAPAETTASTSTTTTQTTPTSSTTSSANTTTTVPNTIGTYDPVTNTYVTSTPATTETTTSTSATDTQESTVSSIQTEITADVELQDWNGTLAPYHTMVDEKFLALLQDLGAEYTQLQQDVVSTVSGTAFERLDTLQCIGVIDNEFDILDEIQETFAQLKNQIAIVATDLHADITATESKIDQNLLTSLQKNIDLSLVQNEITAYETEYATVIDMFAELALEELTNAIDSIELDEEQQTALLNAFDSRVALYEQLESSYEEFLNKSAFSSAIVGPNLQSLVEAKNLLKKFYTGRYMAEWNDEIGGRIPAAETDFYRAQYDTALRQFSTQFTDLFTDLTDGLYPIDQIQAIDDGILGIRKAYLDNDGSFDCRAFATNRSIELSVDQLEQSMDNVIARLASSVQSSGATELPTSTDELVELFTSQLKSAVPTLIDDLVLTQKQQTSTRAVTAGVSLRAGGLSQYAKRQKTVRSYLLDQYELALERGKVDLFVEKVRRAIPRLEAIMNQDGLSSRMMEMLDAIMVVLKEFV